MQPHQHIILEIARERERQMAVEGWTREHDDTHSRGEMAAAAASYAINHHAHLLPEFANPNHINACEGPTLHTTMVHANAVWPWSNKWWKPKNSRRDLIRAAALLVAELERLDRAQRTEAA